MENKNNEDKYTHHSAVESNFSLGHGSGNYICKLKQTWISRNTARMKMANLFFWGGESAFVLESIQNVRYTQCVLPGWLWSALLAMYRKIHKWD